MLFISFISTKIIVTQLKRSAGNWLEGGKTLFFKSYTIMTLNYPDSNSFPKSKLVPIPCLLSLVKLTSELQATTVDSNRLINHTKSLNCLDTFQAT